jgi:prophage antirepressor-like protein
MSNITLFNFDSRQVRVVIDETTGEALFVGKDVCETLGYVNHNDAMKLHCRGVGKRYPIVDSLGRNQEVRVLTEADVMRLIISSKLPGAVAFERWVFEEVLPTIRKTGGFSVKPTVPTAPALPTTYIEALEHLLESKKAEALALEERDKAIATKALIGSKREASAMAAASAASRQVNKLKAQLGFNARHATIRAVEKVTGTTYGWAELRKWCKANGVEAESVPDPLYGDVKAWPSSAWMNVHGVNLSALFVK